MSPISQKHLRIWYYLVAFFFTWSLAVEHFGSEEAAARFFCDVGIIQLSESTDRRQEQVPQPGLLGFLLDSQNNIYYKSVKRNEWH